MKEPLFASHEAKTIALIPLCIAIRIYVSLPLLATVVAIFCIVVVLKYAVPSEKAVATDMPENNERN